MNRSKPSEYIQRLERASTIAGSVVVVGLLLEDGPELWRSLLTRTWPPLIVVGGLLVTVGVLAEVVIPPIVARIAKRIEADAAAEIAGIRREAADANERAANANERASRLELEALELRGQLQHQGPRANLITGEARKKLVEALMPFAKQPVDVRYSASVFGINRRIAQVTPIGDDVVNLAFALVEVFHEADWQVPSEPMPSTQRGHGVAIQIGARASDEAKAAAQAFATALREIIVEVEDPSGEPGEKWRARPSDDPIEPPFSDDTVVVDVLVHP